MDTPSPSPSSNDELRRTCASLQSQINILLFALVVVSGTVGIYLYAQDRWTSRELQGVRGAVITFQREESPNISAFVSKLVDYGKVHPDFAPIMEKYHMADVSTNSAPK